ncbi:MAG TPA: mycofactocin biosynthesis peptidyl-dipeptidase MftE [Ilumatobacter sp.]|nr:mycofactocin biosynthesis peptidyl-dipeptidase MftE [Ilumatobacter sp.]
MEAPDLGAMTWTDVGSPILVVPVGSCEQHGPHLPLHTDTVIAAALAHGLAVARGDCVVAPPLTVTASGEHRGFAGTLSIGNSAMAEVLTELVRSAGWAQGVVFVNGHGGNAVAMARAADTLVRESRRLLVWWPSVPGGDPHAGHVETSLMLALAPDEVRRDRAVAGPVPAMSELVRAGVQPLSASGVLGDPTYASAEEGRRLFEELAAQLAAAVASWADG